MNDRTNGEEMSTESGRQCNSAMLEENGGEIASTDSDSGSLCEIFMYDSENMLSTCQLLQPGLSSERVGVNESRTVPFTKLSTIGR